MKYIKNRNGFLFEQQSNKDLSTPYINKPIPLPKEGQTYNLPYKITCGYKANNCDELHSFQDTSGKDVGNMNMIVKTWLDHFYSKSINPQVSKVDIQVNGMDVTWSVTISESKDGKAWVGFTSRGAGCGIDEQRAKSNLEAGKQKVKEKFTGCEIEDVHTHKHEDDNNGFVQHFIKYTNPTKYPPHSKSAGGSSTSSSSTGSSAGGSKLPTGQVLKVKDVKNLKVGDVLVGTRMTGVNNDVTEPGLYELKVSRNPTFNNRIIWCDVVIDGENKGLELAWPYQGDNSSKFGGGEDNDPLVLTHNTETGYFVNLRMK